MKQLTAPALLLILVLAGCAGTPEEVASSPPAQESPIGTGTGVAVHPDGLVLTAHHVVSKAGTIHVEFTGGRRAVATVEQVDEKHDLALLRLRSPIDDYVGFAPPDGIHMGQEVFTIGYPAIFFLGPHQRFTEGAISSLRGLDELPGTMQISAPINPGNSGGPLLNFEGELVGVVSASANLLPFVKATGSLPQNVSWAMQAKHGASLLDLPPAPPRAASREEAIARASRATCLIYALPPEEPTSASARP